MSIQDHDSHKVDSISGTTTTGHSWDGIEELNTPLPKWWLTILYASIIWAIGYVIVYPAIPLVSSFTQGAFGWSSRAAVEADLAELVQQRAPVVAALSKASITEIEKDPKLLAFARASGRVTLVIIVRPVMVLEVAEPRAIPISMMMIGYGAALLNKFTRQSLMAFARAIPKRMKAICLPLGAMVCSSPQKFRRWPIMCAPYQDFQQIGRAHV